jgi:alanine transaminase
MYLFSKLELPQKFIKSLPNGIVPDVAWTQRLLEHEGIIGSPGSGFQQKAGTHHFRLTFLPDENAMEEVIRRITRFQTTFMDEFA